MTGLAFGLRHHPEDLTAVWGARLIWPNDLVHDRQDLISIDDEAKAALVAWLNGGALKAALTAAAEQARAYDLRPTEDRETTLYEDESGVVKANPQASHGYLYVAAWLT